MASADPPTTPSNPFSGARAGGDDNNGGGERFDAFSLSAGTVSSSPMPSLHSIQQQEQQMMQQSSSVPHQQQLNFDSLPSPEELLGPMNDTSSSSNWPPSTASAPKNTNYGTNINTSNSQSFLSKLLSCGGICSVEALRPYFDIDTADIFVRMTGSVKYLMVNDGFRNEVLYSDNAFRLAYRDTTTTNAASATDGDGNNEGGGNEGENKAVANPSQQTTTTTTTSPGKGPDLYGPIWITLTLVFFVAVTSNMSLYIHHHTKKSLIDEGGIAAEEEWDYDINQLLHATWILYSFTLGLPTVLYFVLRLVGVNNMGLVELICLYGYSLVPYLFVSWLCIIPYGWVQWMVLGIATVLSGMLVLRNVIGPILDSGSGGGGGGGIQGKGGGLIMCLVGCHFVFYLVLKLAFYHHS